jgi:hypothetical protein
MAVYADLDTVSFNRKVVKPITLSDGTVLPAGTFLSMPTAMIARDPTLYTDPDSFKPWRFEEMRNTAPSEVNKHQFARYVPSPKQLPLWACCPYPAFCSRVRFQTANSANEVLQCLC